MLNPLKCLVFFICLIPICFSCESTQEESQTGETSLNALLDSLVAMADRDSALNPGFQEPGTRSQSVMVSFGYGGIDLEPVLELEESLRSRLKSSQTGVFEGHDIAPDNSQILFFLTGPDAAALAASAQSLMDSCSFCSDVEIELGE